MCSQEPVQGIIQSGNAEEVGGGHQQLTGASGSILPTLDLGDVVGINLNHVFFARHQRLRHEDSTLEAAQVLLIGPGIWETQVTFERLRTRESSVCSDPTSRKFADTINLRARVVYGNRSGQPITAGQLFGTPLKQRAPFRIRRGDVLPLTFRVYDARGHEVTTEFGGGHHRITQILHLGPLEKLHPGQPIHCPNESAFRYQIDVLGSGVWKCEIDTSARDFIAGHMYEMHVCLNDGSVHSCRFEIA